nr:MAG TPA: hypothetical protein [Caudoviricetes sp.]
MRIELRLTLSHLNHVLCQLLSDSFFRQFPYGSCFLYIKKST